MGSRSVFYTTLGVASSTGSIADLNDLDDELSKILIRDVIRGDKSINTQDDMNRTALFYSGFEETQKLLKLGINPFLKDVNRKMAHEYTRDPNSRNFIIKALAKFEESVRDKTIPIMTQFRQFFKKYMETTYDIVFPDVILILDFMNSHIGKNEKYMIRLVSSQSEQEKLNFIYQWLLDIANDMIKQYIDSDHVSVKKEYIANSLEFQLLFENEKCPKKIYFIHSLVSLIVKNERRLLYPDYLMSIPDQTVKVCSWDIKFTSLLTVPGSKRIINDDCGQRICIF